VPENQHVRSTSWGNRRFRFTMPGSFNICSRAHIQLNVIQMRTAATTIVLVANVMRFIMSVNPFWCRWKESAPLMRERRDRC